MPRQLRIDYPGAIHHVMSRGDRREDIYHDEVDRQDFLKTLAETCQKTDWQVHAYCLMSNHFHLVLETPNANLVEGMQWLLSTYTIRLNRRHETPGHVFSGRYKALIVEGEGDGYLKTVCDYVHLNPVRAHLLRSEERLLSYPWSSLGWYLAAPGHRPGWLRVDRLLGEHGIGRDTAGGRLEFERRMEGRRLAEADLRPRRKSDPEKLRIAAWLRRETILSLKRIATRVGLGSSKSANSNLHTWMQANGKSDRAVAESKNQKNHAKKPNHTKA